MASFAFYLFYHSLNISQSEKPITNNNSPKVNGETEKKEKQKNTEIQNKKEQEQEQEPFKIIYITVNSNEIEDSIFNFNEKEIDDENEKEFDFDLGSQKKSKETKTFLSKNDYKYLKEKAFEKLSNLPVGILATDEITKDGDFEKMNEIRQEFLHVWDNYKKYAWGYDQYKPKTKQPQYTLHLGSLIVNNLDTLLIMGMEKEYLEAREWVQNDLQFNSDAMISSSEAVLQILGGLLSAYHLSNYDELYLNKAIELSEKLLSVVFNDDKTGFPAPFVNLFNGEIEYFRDGSEKKYKLEELGSFQLEFSYLSRITGDIKYRNAAIKILKTLKELDNARGAQYLLKNEINTDGEFSGYINLDKKSRVYYEYLLKLWVLEGEKDNSKIRNYFDRTMEKLIERMIVRSRFDTRRFTFVGELKEKNNIVFLTNNMHQISCFAGAMFILASQTKTGQFPTYYQIAKEITDTCYQMYHTTKTGLSGEKVEFTTSEINHFNQKQVLRPQTIESIFYLWRYTNNENYREMGWEIYKNVKKLCKSEFGYSSLKGVNEDDPQQLDLMYYFFLSQTLKYFYLLFSPSSFLSLNSFVFNAAAHPLPIYR
ncbi:mannosyl-oligosaccharide alpha-12-mannosidase-related [Anaeramoeba flamelloides]|uniref:alpha-1,2-Mannosidase n=1 Tax=Anaeramoeba flamelloides TaxID=1746091 RepID=A0AAV7ZGQ4_9EUKA|nr:mannosyl-oligosaccharide alpha-12-mannosidase-related [Anaeramoeba flamelloides]